MNIFMKNVECVNTFFIIIFNDVLTALFLADEMKIILSFQKKSLSSLIFWFIVLIIACLEFSDKQQNKR